MRHPLAFFIHGHLPMLPRQPIGAVSVALLLVLAAFAVAPAWAANTVTVKPPSSGSPWTLTLPTSPGTSGYLLSTDGTGVTSWVGPGITGSGTTNYVARWTPNGSTLGIGTLYDNGTDVGIGTTSPSYPLQVNGSIVSGLGASGTAGAIGIFPNNSQTYFWIDNPGSNYLRFSNGVSPGTNPMVLLNTGYVGIGTTSPGDLLEVNEANGSAGITVQNSSSTTGQYPQISINNYAAATGGFGLLGFGTARGSYASPAAIQSGDYLGGIVGSGYGTSTWDYNAATISFVADGTFTNSSGPSAITFNTTPPGSVNAVSERMRITSGGNVGIGTATPSYPLDIYGGISAYTDVHALHVSGDGETGGAVDLMIDNVDASDHQAQLVLTSQGTGKWYLQNSTQANTTDDFGIYSSALNKETLVIGTTGVVGIGTTTPQAELDVNGGVRIGTESASCTSTNVGEVRYNSTSTYMEYCNGSAWNPFEQPQCSTGSTAACWLPATRSSGDSNFTAANILSGVSILGVTGTGPPCPMPPQIYALESEPYESGYCCNTPNAGTVWSDGTYIYIGTNDPEIAALSFNTSTKAWTYITKLTGLTGSPVSIKGDGTYIYVAENGGSGKYGLDAFTFNGTAFTKVSTTYTSVIPSEIFLSGGLIYLADTTNGLKVFSFNGTTFTLLATYTISGINVKHVWGDGTYIYVSDSGHNEMIALTYSSGSFTAGGTTSGWSATGPFMGDGTYIYVQDSLATQNAVRAYTYNGTSWTQVGSVDPLTYPSQTLVSGSYVYIGGTNVWRAYTFNGSSFTYVGAITTAVNNGTTGWTDGTYMYAPDGAYNGQRYVLDAIPMCH